MLHGGGNTSVKTRMRDLAGDEVEVLCVKGSGADMAAIEPAGLPAVRLEPLQQLRARDDLSDDDMVRVQRANLLDPMAPNPSVELLLHAFMPHKFVDHTHANAVLSLIDQPDGAELVRRGLRRPRRPRALRAAGLRARQGRRRRRSTRIPKVEGLILDKHGIFTFGASAREAYERMIELVTPRRGAAARRTARRCSRPRSCRSRSRRAPTSRRSCAARAA